MRRSLPLLLFSLALAAQAGEVAQFRAEEFGADWRATRGGAVLRAVHPATLECCHNNGDANVAALRLPRR